jgi:chaperonin cofactor prefoldin
MDTQSLINLLGGAALLVAGWFLREMWDAVKELRKDIGFLKVELPKEYVQKADLDKRMDHIEQMLQRIFDKLDNKVDK